MKRRNDKGCKLLLLAVSDAVRAGDAHIKEEFNGHNHPELPRKYGVTERWVRSLCGPGQTEGQLTLSLFLPPAGLALRFGKGKCLCRKSDPIKQTVKSNFRKLL